MAGINRRGGPRANAGRHRAEPTRVVRLPVQIAELATRIAGRGVGSGNVAGFHAAEARVQATSPLMTCSVACGFPSPAEDSLDRSLCLNELHGVGQPSVFFARIQGDSMIGAGLMPGDYAVVNRAARPRHNLIILAILNGEFTVKRYQLRNGHVFLHAENEAYSDIEVTAQDEFQVWGVVTGSTRVF